MNWNDERVEALRKLWSEGLSASQIASQLGGVSRNAVIGKVHRLKLSSRGRTTAAPARPKKVAKPPTPASSIIKSSSRGTTPSGGGRPMTVSIGATALQVQFDTDYAPQHHQRAALQNVVVPISRRLQLVELTERTCKWPNGDPLAEDFSFCGTEAGESGPYCQYHSRLAYQPAAERRRR
ncbi:MAG: GcrA family cell cycle regulator [Mesorhizobium sp.]